MAHAELKLNVGDTLQLQYLDRNKTDRLQVQVVGYLPGRSVIVTTPRLDGRVLMMREGQPFVVRILSGNRVVGFNTKVLRTCASPYPYMHLAYPEEMEQIVVRKAQRVSVNLFCSVTNENPEYKTEKAQAASICDLSTSGALIKADKRLADDGDEITLNFAFIMSGIEKFMVLSCRVRNVNLEGKSDGTTLYYHGLEILQLAEADLFALHGFVYEQIVKNLSE